MNISTIPTSLMKASKVDKAILPQAECEISSIPVRVYQQIYQAILNGEDGDLNIKDLGSFGDLDAASDKLSSKEILSGTEPMFKGKINVQDFLVVQTKGTDTYQYMFFEGEIKVRSIKGGIAGEWMTSGGVIDLSDIEKAIEDLKSEIEAESKARTDADNELDEKISKSVQFTDISSKQNPNRKAIVLGNNDMLLGTTTSGAANNLIMMNKWDIVDAGTSSNKFNINVPKGERPTVQEAGQSGDQANKIAYVSDIEGIDASISEVKIIAEAKVAKVSLVQDKENPLIYKLMVDNTENGTINIPKDQFLKSVEFQPSGVLNFVFETSTGEQEVPVDISSMIEVYTAGNGIGIKDNQISIKVSTDNKFLIVNESGELLTKQSIKKTGSWKAQVTGADGSDVEGLAIDFSEEANQLSQAIDAKADKTGLEEEVKRAEKAEQDINSSIGTLDASVAKLRTDVDYESARALEAEANINKELARRVVWDETKTKIVLPSGGQIVGTKYGTTGENPEDGATIAQLNKWNVMDIGSVKYPLNLNVPKDVRPTVQEAGQSGEDANKIAYLSDIEALQKRLQACEEAIKALQGQ
jgi:hypothetical protein